MGRTTAPHRGARRAGVWLACLALFALALPASAARVVEVRVGQHPTFTRVVFELDHMRGYRLRREADADVLVVSLDAQSTPLSLSSRGMVDRVVVDQAERGAVARIHLKGSAQNPRVQEMILAKPPRIVLDILKPGPAAQTASSGASRTAARPAPRAPSLSATPAQPPSAAPPAAEPSPSIPRRTRTASNPAASPSTARAPARNPARPTPRRPTAESAARQPSHPAVRDSLGTRRAAATPGREADAEGPFSLTEPAPVAVFSPDELEVVSDREGAPRAAQTQARPAPTLPEPTQIARPVPKLSEPGWPSQAAPTAPAVEPGEAVSETSDESGGGLKPTLFAGAALAVVLGIAGFVLLRRRKQAAEEDWVPEDEEGTIFEAPVAPAPLSVDHAVGGEALQEPAADSYAEVADGGNPRIPAGGFEMDGGAGVEDDTPADRDDDADLFGPPGVEPSLEAPADNVVSIFDTGAGARSAPDGESPMSDTIDLPADASTMPTTAPAAGMGGELGGDVARLLEALERRVNDLESRLDEANEARDKLERQVAAQAEELRVQRAAIARTQRALRGMNRSADDRASEPALRDPNQARRVTGA